MRNFVEPIDLFGNFTARRCEREQKVSRLLCAFQKDYGEKEVSERMSVTKEKKAEILEKLKKIVKDSISLVLINFHGMPVKETREVRKALREKGVNYFVAKKTLAKKALTEAGITGTIPETPGELGIIYLPAQAGGNDSITAAREIYTFQKKLDKKITIVGGVFEGKFMNQAEMTSLANIPDLKTLHAQFVNLINSPIAGFVRTLGQIAEKKG